MEAQPNIGFIGLLVKGHVRRLLTTIGRDGIGAFSKVSIGYFDWERKDYLPIEIDEQVEVLALTGDVALDAGEPTVHAHVVLGRRDGSTAGGHLLEAHVRPTLELVLTEASTELRKSYDRETGLALIDVARSGSTLNAQGCMNGPTPTP